MKCAMTRTKVVFSCGYRVIFIEILLNTEGKRRKQRLLGRTCKQAKSS